MTRWHPRLELARLLQALSDDIIAATDEELREIQGRDLAGTARQIRRLVKAAQAAEGGEPRIVSSSVTERGLEPVLSHPNRH